MKRSLTSALSVALAVPLTVGLLAAPASAEKTLVDIPLPNGFSPEGIAIHEGVAYTGSLVDGAILQVDLSSDEVEEFAPSPGPGKLAGGMDVDRFDRLWVAGGGENFFPGVAPSFRVYDTGTGELVADVEVPDGETLNDVFVTKDAAWFTDSFAPQLFKVPIAKDGEIGSPERVELGGDWEPSAEVDANGIVGAPGGKLIVGQTLAPDGTGGALYVIDADAEGVAEAQRITLSGGTLEAGTDGLVLIGQKLYVVNPEGVVKIRLNKSLTTGTVITTLDVGAEWATTAKKYRSSLYVVDGNFGENFANIGNPDAEFKIVKVPFGLFHG
jgi:hypothetical protein